MGSDPSRWEESEAGRFEQRLFVRLKLLMALRLGTVLLLLGLTTYLQSRQNSELIDVSFILLCTLCASSFALTIPYAIAILKRFNPVRLAYIQLLMDVLFIGALIYVTNGHDIFTFLYILIIISSSIIVGRRGAILLSLLSTLTYGILADLQFFHILPMISKRPFAFVRLDDLLTSVFYTGSAFLIVAILSGYLAEELQRVGRKLEEKQVNLEDLENLNRNVVESLSSGLVTTNNDFVITSFNRFAEEVTGLSFPEVFNQPIESVFSGINQHLDNVNDRWEEGFLRERDQMSLVLGFSCSALRHQDGRILGRIINFQDVTYLKQIQERMRESDKMAAIGRLAASIAHEIRNPLASMSGSVQLLGDELHLKGQHRQLMEIVVRETDRLNLLIRDFLEFAKPQKSLVERVNLRDLVLETVAVSRQQFRSLEKRSVKVESQIPEKNLVVEADAGKLRQVLWNLLLNAYQAIETESGEIRVEVKEVSGAEPMAWLEITDNGVGISEKDLEFIYEPFFTTKSHGTGMGLATVRRIVQESGWQIEVESVVGSGSTFRLTIPLVEAREIESQERPVVS